MIHVRVTYAGGRSVDIDVDAEILVADFIKVAAAINSAPVVALEFLP